MAVFGDVCIRIHASCQYVAECCSVLLCVAVCCSVLQCVAVCCSVLQCVAVCCSVVYCFVDYHESWDLQLMTHGSNCNTLQYAATSGGPFYCGLSTSWVTTMSVAVCVLQCVAVFTMRHASVLQCGAVWCVVLWTKGHNCVCWIDCVCNTLQHIVSATFCNTNALLAGHAATTHDSWVTVQHTAPQCTTLQRTFTQCNA